MLHAASAEHAWIVAARQRLGLALLAVEAAGTLTLEAVADVLAHTLVHTGHVLAVVQLTFTVDAGVAANALACVASLT